MQYTEQQRQAIEVSGRNLLVSAAAGSGKTAVLIQRIVEKIMSRQTELNRLLVVTFTRAAASEMKQRVNQALYRAVDQASDKEQAGWLNRQIDRLALAPIMTIHSFCLSIIKENYHQLGLTPDFRLMNDIEQQILSKEVMDQLLEEAYQKASPSFIQVVETFQTDKQDVGVDRFLFELYENSRNYPWPEEWLAKVLEDYYFPTSASFYQSTLIKRLLAELTERCQQMEEKLVKYTQLWHMADLEQETNATISQHYYQWLMDLRQNLSEANNGLNEIISQKLTNHIHCFQDISYSRKRKGFDLELLDEHKAIKKELEEKVKEIKALFPKSLAIENQQIKRRYEVLRECIELTNEYAERYRKAKADNGYISFQDIEHLALTLLYQRDDGQRCYSDLALRYQSLFDEVLIDEYQDINLIQETILQAVSREKTGQPNRFMVGDVKQSIYKFRHAKPELFQQKYDCYGDLEGLFGRIDMQQNFRTRRPIIDFTNHIFEGLMTRQVGGIDYDDKAKLVYAADYYDKTNRTESAKLPEVMIYQADLVDCQYHRQRSKIEARLIVERIRQLVSSGQMIYDKQQAIYRPIVYGDITLLMRSPNPVVDDYKSVFKEMKIPLVAEATGYFETLEIRTILNFLKVIVNPLDDIALVAVLRSPLVGLDEQQLAWLKVAGQSLDGETSSGDKKVYFYDYLRRGWQQLQSVISGDVDEDETLDFQALKDKLNAFFNLYQGLKAEADYQSVHQLIDSLYDQTHYLNQVVMRADGRQKVANLEYLIEQARSYDESIGQGLPAFLRQTDKMKEHHLGISEPPLSGKKEDSVRLMSIHKSKGLEFPVVFVCQMGKQFNQQDLRGKWLIHSEAGVGLTYVDYQKRYKKEGIHRYFLKALMEKESLAEEQRLLYVAFTRARDCLFLIGHRSWKDEDTVVAMASAGQRSYYDLILSQLGKAQGEFKLDLINQIEYDCRLTRDTEKLLITDDKIFDESLTIETLINQWALDSLVQEKTEQLTFVGAYDYENLTKKKAYTSVSEIISQTQSEQTDRLNEVAVSGITSNLSGLTAAEKGSLYHRIFALLPLNLVKTEVTNWLAQLVEKSYFTMDEMMIVEEEKLICFLETDLCRRMAEAEKGNCLKREQPFVLARPVDSDGLIKKNEMEVGSRIEASSVTDFVMVQGIIDIFFIEKALTDTGEFEEKVVLVDYKTDGRPIMEGRPADDEQFVRVLRERHTKQMMAYRQALETLTDYRVSEVYLYSLTLGRTISIDLTE